LAGKQSSNNSSHIVEREILSVLNENKKKRKLELPEKYAKVYEELQKDRLDVLDLGGAFLGDQTVLAISEVLESRSKLKSAKLMSNKISD
jgi:Ran GTPase-activating protein (RanGAP) involved in mRNA processing and transport